MNAPRFLAIDLATRPDLSGVALRERVRCPGRPNPLRGAAVALLQSTTLGQRS